VTNNGAILPIVARGALFKAISFIGHQAAQPWTNALSNSGDLGVAFWDL
jgi:hypothetical protein